MNRPLPSLRLHGDRDAAKSLVDQLSQQGFSFKEESADVELVLSGPLPASTKPIVRFGVGSEAWTQLESGAVIDVLEPGAPIEATRARLIHAARPRLDGDLDHEAFIAQLSDGVAVVGRDLHVALLNPAGHALLGKPAAWRGARLFDLVESLDPVTTHLLNREIQRGGRVLSVDLDVRLVDGRRTVLSVSAGPLEDAAGARAILTFRDVTDERATAEELRRTRDFLGRLIDASSDAIVASDLAGRILVFNRAAETLFGFGAEEARTQSGVANLFADDQAPTVMRRLRESPEGRLAGLRCLARTAYGEKVPVELSAALVRVAGREEALLGLLRDLRERDRMDAELSAARTRLLEIEKQRAVTALAGATAHELNQPLTVILGLVDLLRRRIEGEGHRESLEALGREAERMAQIVRKVGTLTRIETVAYPGRLEIADLGGSK